MTDDPGQPLPPAAAGQPAAAMSRRRSGRRAVLAAAGLLVLAGVVVAVVLATGGGSGGTSAGTFDGFVASDMAIAPDGARAYVLGVSTSGGSTAVQVVPVDPRTGKPGTPIALPAPARDHGSNGTITLAPGGRTGYVSYPGDSTITPVDLAAGKAGHPITLRAALLGGSGSGVCGLAVTPGGTAGYVTGCGAVDAGTVLPVSLPSGTPGRPIRINVGTTGGSLRGIAITPGGRTAYLTEVQAAAGSPGVSVLPVSLPSGAVGRPIRVASGTVDEASLTLARGTGTGYLTSLVDAGSGQAVTVTPVNLATGRPGAAIRIGTGAQPVFGDTGYSLALTPGGTTGYVIFVQGPHKAGAIVPLALPGGPPGPPVRLGAGVQGAAIAVAPNGTAAYVASTAGQGGLHTRVGVLPPVSG